MSRINLKKPAIKTHEGGKAKRISPELALRRSVLSCLLWEKEFYEDGESIATRIKNLVPKVHPRTVAALAWEARNDMHLRHVPLLLCRELARNGSLVAGDLNGSIQRADELAEFLSIYWKEGRQPLSAQVKKGLAKAFQRFDAYQLKKYDRQDREVKLRDVLFLCHAEPKDESQANVWKMLVDKTLPEIDTWETALTRCHTPEEKRAEWVRLLRGQRLGAMALLRNLRNMSQAGVCDALIKGALESMKPTKVLPFRFISAARHAPDLEPWLERAMFRCLAQVEPIKGKTVLLIDVSGSMEKSLSSKSELSRMDAACGLAMLAREVCENVRIFTFSFALREIPPRRGFALRDAIVNSQEHSGTLMGTAVKALYAPRGILAGPESIEDYFVRRYSIKPFPCQGLTPDRLIVITDEQAHDNVPDPTRGTGTVVNIASAQNGVGYGAWTHIDGWSEAVIKYIKAMEEFEKND